MPMLKRIHFFLFNIICMNILSISASQNLKILLMCLLLASEIMGRSFWMLASKMGKLGTKNYVSQCFPTTWLTRKYIYLKDPN